MSTLPPAVPLSQRELVVSRTIAAPRGRVFEVWTKRLAEWWGPYGLSTPVCEMDLRPGGVFRTVLRAPDGAEYPTRGVFLEVVRPERIVFTDAYDPGWQPNPDIFFTGVTTFEELGGGRARCTVRARHWSVASRNEHVRLGFYEGWGESLDRLGALVMQGWNLETVTVSASRL